MSEALKIDFESTNDNNKETTKELWGKANSILMAFKSKFGESSVQFQNVQEEYRTLYQKIEDAKNGILDETNSAKTGLQNYIDDREFQEIRKNFQVLETSFISLIKTSPSDLNSSDIKKISDPELKALFDFFSDSTNWKELSFIKNKDFMFELISYILKNKSGEFNSYSELYNYLNPEIKNVPDINKLFILYNPQNISYISNDFINDGNNNLKLIFNDPIFKSVFYDIWNDSIKEIFYKQLFTKISNPEIFQFVLKFCSINEGKKIYNFLPNNKKTDEIMSFISENLQTSKNEIKDSYIDRGEKIGKMSTEDFGTITEIIISSSKINSIPNDKLIKIAGLINSYNGENIDPKIIVSSINKNNSTLINILNDYILANLDKAGNTNNPIFKNILKLVEKGYLGELYSINNNPKFIKTIIENINFDTIFNILNQLSPEIYENNEILDLIVGNKNFPLDYLYFVRITSFKQLSHVYNKLIEKNKNPGDIFLNPIFSEYTDYYIKERIKANITEKTPLEIEYGKSKEYIGSKLSQLNYLTLQFNKDKILEIIKSNGISDNNAERFYQKFLLSTSSMAGAKANYPDLLRLANGDPKKVENIYEEILRNQKQYLSKKDGKLKNDINSLLEGIDLDKLFKDKTKIAEFFKGKNIDLEVVLTKFRDYKDLNPKGEKEIKEFYQWRIRNDFIKSLGFGDNLSSDEIQVKNVILNITKIEFLDKEIDQKIATKETFFKYISGEIKEEDYNREIEKYKKTVEKSENQAGANNQENLENTFSNSEFQENNISQVNGVLVFNSGGKNVEITSEEAKNISRNPKIKENFVNFINILIDLNITKLWKYRNQIFKAIANKEGSMVFNSKEDFLNKNEVRIFLISILKSINIPLDVENENIPLKELVTKFKKLNYTGDIISGEKNTNTKGESRIEEAFRLKFLSENGIFLQEKFSKSI